MDRPQISFETAIVQAIVNRFFEGGMFVDQFGSTQFKEAVAGQLANQLLQRNLPVIVEALSEKIDMSKLAEEIAEKLGQHLTSAMWTSKYNQKDLRERIFNEYATLKAQQMMEKENDTD